MTPKLLAIDLDGTLLNHDRTISARNREAIQRAREAGVTVVLASGRIRPSMRKFADMLDLQYPIICGNGTYAFLSAEQELFSLYLTEAATSQLIDYAQRHDLHLNLYTPGSMYFLSQTTWGDLYKQRVDSVHPEILGPETPRQFVKAMVVDEPGRIAYHRQAILDILQDPETRATESEPEYLEFMPKQATKGYALSKMAEHLGIPQEATAAIGDYLNDLEMLRWAGISAAVENAHYEAKKAAKVTVSSNERDGVAEFIDVYVLKQRE